MGVATEIGEARRAKLAAARLYLICDSEPAGAELEVLLRGAIAGGVDVVQLRDKRLAPAELAGVGRRAAALCHELDALLLVNDHPHVALAADADGVHVGQEDMPVAEVRELVGADLLVGLSTHTPAQVEAASASDANRSGGGRPIADYIGVGPVFETPTKPGRGAVGVDLVSHAAATSALAFFAIGGIDAGNVRGVLRAGARRVAVVRAIASAIDPESAAHELRAELDQVPVEHTDRAAAAA
jgi:thiamine-phosphate pyrophosphorylase